MPAMTTDAMLREEQALLAQQRRVRASRHGDAGPVGLAISGGGIRSATFSLGFLQGLSRLQILTAFDYLSTVSGGGYIGSWLSAWMHRHPGGAAGVMQELAGGKAGGAPGASYRELPPINHLRSHSNYLSPRVGLFSADTWTLAGTFMRNLLVNWLILVPYFAIVLAIPIFATDVLQGLAAEELGDLGRAFYNRDWMQWVGWGSLALLAISVAVMGANLPGSQKRDVESGEDGQGLTDRGFIGGVLAPLTIAALGCSLYWFLVKTAQQGTIPTPSWTTLVVAGVLVHGLGFTLHWWFIVQRRHSSLKAMTPTFKKPLLALLGVGVSGALGGWLVWLLGDRALPMFATELGDLTQLDAFQAYFPSFVVLALPLLMGALLIAMTLYLAIASRCMSDDDREWYARAGSWVMAVGVGWLCLSSLALFGPLAIRESARMVTLAGVVNVVSGAITWRLGWSASTSGEGKSGKSASSGREWVLLVAAGVFVVAFLVLAATAVTAMRDLLVGNLGLSATRSMEAIFVGLVLVIVVMTIAADVNVFSLHATYRDRLVRAYLGASRTHRHRNRFTGLDPHDDFRLSHLAAPYFSAADWPSAAALAKELSATEDRKAVDEFDRELIAETLKAAATAEVPPDVESLVGRWDAVLGRGEASLRTRAQQLIDPDRLRPPLHIINTALNLTTGEELAWQERKAAPFSFTPLHAGSSATGFRRVGTESVHLGATLGSAMAISGAAANPAMGYHSSPLVTFLLTLLNGRLGVWTGNPADDRTYNHSHPRGFRLFPPALLEAFGQTTSSGKYVNLSDGGHIENLGVYELVRRQCRLIVAIDSGADEHFAFEDLGNAVRKVRVDLGVEITFKGFRLGRKKQARYVAIGEITYPDKTTGSLLYVKPAVFGGEPADVQQYKRSHPVYPHESTVDQFFGESQFESYRALGEHIALTIAGGPAEGPDVRGIKNAAELFRLAGEYAAAAPDRGQPEAEPRSGPEPGGPDRSGIR